MDKFKYAVFVWPVSTGRCELLDSLFKSEYVRVKYRNSQYEILYEMNGVKQLEFNCEKKSVKRSEHVCAK